MRDGREKSEIVAAKPVLNPTVASSNSSRTILYIGNDFTSSIQSDLEMVSCRDLPILDAGIDLSGLRCDSASRTLIGSSG